MLVGVDQFKLTIDLQSLASLIQRFSRQLGTQILQRCSLLILKTWNFRIRFDECLTDCIHLQKALFGFTVVLQQALEMTNSAGGQRLKKEDTLLASDLSGETPSGIAPESRSFLNCSATSKLR